jgi:hypothetical protein
MKKIQINEQVMVTAMGFRKSKNLVAYPRKMEFRGSTYSFVDAGLRCLMNCGGQIAEFLTLSDGVADYHLKHDMQNGWILLSIAS